jgi:hypothetical protein
LGRKIINKTCSKHTSTKLQTTRTRPRSLERSEPKPIYVPLYRLIIKNALAAFSVASLGVKAPKFAIMKRIHLTRIPQILFIKIIRMTILFLHLDRAT